MSLPDVPVGIWVRPERSESEETVMSETLREQLERELGEPLHYVSQEARYFVLDALACHMHNKGYFIQGCTEETDARWFARALWTEFHGEAVSAGEFDNQKTEDQEVWIKTARCAISRLPSLMPRVASRAIHYSQALREMERTSRIELKELEKVPRKTNFVVK